MTHYAWARLPILRSISESTIDALAPYVREHQLAAGVEIIREGDAAGSLFFLAIGNANAVRKDSSRPIGALEAPTVFGEMALVAATSRLASVVTTSPCTVFEVHCNGVFAAAANDPKLTELLLGFHHDRLWRNVLAVSPIFSALGEGHMRALAAAFAPLNVAAGFTLLTEGAPGEGLFIVLRGHCQVLRGASVIAELSEGELFGEISLALFDRPCTATVRATSDVVVLKLSREDFQRLIMSDAEMRNRIMQLALGRLNAGDKAAADSRKPAIF